MATSLRTSGLFLLLFLIINTCAVSPPWIFSLEKECVGSKCGIKVLSSNVYEWSLTARPGARGEPCEPPFEYTQKLLVVEVDVPKEKLYFCAKGADGEWIHQGDGIYLSADDVTAIR